MDEPSHPPTPISSLDLGAHIGQARAFGFVARSCSAASAQRLKEIKENRWYESLGLNWEDFCTRHAGVSRPQADRLIERLNEFGEPYFQLSGIAPVSAETYRLLAPTVTPEGIEIDGETVPLTPENAPRIRRAVQDLRAELRGARQLEPSPDLTNLQIRLDACFSQMRRLSSTLDAGTRAALRGLVAYSIEKLRAISV